MTESEGDFAELVKLVRAFAAERHWEPFHQPKNLAMALAGEAGELVAIFQWLTPEESSHATDDEARSQEIYDEVADIFIYLLRMADVLEIDLSQAVRQKLEKNARRYPVDIALGRAEKYTQLQSAREPEVRDKGE